MKWLRNYSIVLLIISSFIIFLSFFLMDILPIAYQYYMGYDIASTKINKLVTFGSEMIYEIRVYALLSILAFMAMYFVRKLKHYFILLAILLVIHFLFIAEITDIVLFKRIYLMFITLPLLWIFFDFFKFKNETYYNQITHAFLYITLLSLVLPGLYIPPFFSGISGWTVQIDKDKKIAIDGVFLVRKDGKEIRYSRAIVSPINFLNRLNTYMLRAHPKKVSELLNFYKETYIKKYDLLKKGTLPSQKILGKWAYPTHNPQGNFDYSKFPPKSIKEIKLSTKYYSWDKKFLGEDVKAREVWN